MEGRGEVGAKPASGAPNPVPSAVPPDPLAMAARMAVDWQFGVGFLRLHAAIFAVAGAGLLFVDLIVDPADPWALDLLRVWLIVLCTHGAALVAGWVTWRAVRPDRLAASPLARILAGPEEEDEGAAGMLGVAGPLQPLPATGRFSTGRPASSAGGEDGPRGITGVLAAVGDAVLDLGDLAHAGIARMQSSIARGIDWIRNDDDDGGDDADDGDDAPPPGPVVAAYPVPDDRRDAPSR